MDKLNRRTFIKGAGTAAATASLFNINRLGRTASDEVRVAVMGIHGRGQDHIAGYSALSGVRIAAICDVDARLFPDNVKKIGAKQGSEPKTYDDVRKMLEDKGIDAVSMATCNHWHALGTIWAVQAGKDVYVEKPACHNVYEGRKMIEAARKYNKIVQVGSQGRSAASVRKAVELLRDGAIGEVFYARGLCFKNRESIGFKPDQPTPPGVNYDVWLGPAKLRPFNENLVHYNWHWFWDFGNGDLGNQGVHQMDLARWGLGQTLPVKVSSMGGRYGYKDQGETPNTQTCSMTFQDGKMLVFEVRGRHTNDEAKVKVGVLFYGSNGWLAVYGSGGPYNLFLNGKEEPEPVVEGVGEDHFNNFIKAVRSRNYRDLSADVEQGVLSADLCHLANIAYRTGRTLEFDPKSQTFKSDQQANQLLTREYRAPYVVPENV